MLSRPLATIVATLCLMSPASAQQDDIARFVALKTAQAIDEKCRFYKQFERYRIDGLEYDLLETLDFARSRESGKITEDEYKAAYNELVSEAKAKADSIACTDSATAGSHIMPFRGEVMPPIYADLTIAFQLGNLTPEQAQAARAVEGMIQPLYGQNWHGFVQYAQQQAQLKLEQAKQADLEAATTEELFGITGYSLGAYSLPPSTINFDTTIRTAVKVVDDILFEIIAEQSRFRLTKKHNSETLAYRTSLLDGTLNVVADVWLGPDRYPTLEDGLSVYAVFTVHQDGSVRVMTYGRDATRLAQGSLTVLVHPHLSDELANNSFSYVKTQEWWDAATIFRGTRIDDACLGGPCFSLPAEIIEAILAGRYGQDIRMYFSTDSDPAMPPPEDVNIISSSTYELFARQAFIAAEDN